MRTRFTPLLTPAIAFIVIAAMAFVAVCDTPAYAKGAAKSDKGDSGKSESSKSNSSSGSDHKSSPPSRSDSSSRSSDYRSSPPSRSDSFSGSSSSRSGSIFTPRSSGSGKSDLGSVFKGRAETRSPSSLRTSPPPKSDSSGRSGSIFTPRSSDNDKQRDLGSVFKGRVETRSPSSQGLKSPPKSDSSGKSGSIFTPRSSDNDKQRDLGSVFKGRVETRSPSKQTDKSDTRRPEISGPARDKADSGSIFKGRVETRSPSIRTDTSETRRPPISGAVASKGSYRKEYADIGKIWSSRHERRDTYSDRVQRDQRYDRDDHRIFPYYHVYSSPTFHYRSYCYDYYPDYSYPWAYCHYHTRVPPYFYSSRIIIVPTFVSRRLYIQVPIFIDWEDDYYLYDSYGRDLRYALSDIRRAWERGDPDLIEEYLRPGSRIAIYLNADYAYSIDVEEFYDMTRDAVETVSTRSFTFDRQSRHDRNTITAFGEHRYVDEDGDVKTVYVSYTFERYGSRWYITEVGSSPYRF